MPDRVLDELGLSLSLRESCGHTVSGECASAPPGTPLTILPNMPFFIVPRSRPFLAAMVVLVGGGLWRVVGLAWVGDLYS